MNKELIRVDLPSSNGRTHHFHDTHGVRTVVNRMEKSSAGEHMAVSDYVWIDPKTKKETRESSQWGTHFDTPYHFDANGNTYLDTRRISGPAQVIDLSRDLALWSDGYAITNNVVEKWFLRQSKRIHMLSEAWERILLRVLNNEDTQSVHPLSQFPYFQNGEVVESFLNRVAELWDGKQATVFCTESPSVDGIDCGHLCVPGADGNGGAHGAFYRRGVLIGENWDFSRIENHTTGFLHVFFTPESFQQDSKKVDAAFFEPFN